jgi:hypothetical protein
MAEAHVLRHGRRSWSEDTGRAQVAPPPVGPKRYNAGRMNDCCDRRELLRLGLGSWLGLLLAGRGAGQEGARPITPAEACIVLWCPVA